MTEPLERRARLGLPPPAEAARLLAVLSQPPERAARLLLGTVLVRQLGRQALAARIVETEAYLGQDDPAAHAYRGRTTRTAPLWGLPGTLYVYFVYGMHHCLNLSVQPEGVPGCVLIRAAEPLGELSPGSCRGPGRLCRALQIDVSFSGRHVFEPGSRLWLREGASPATVAVTGRVGIRHAAEEPRRFYDAESRAVSAGRGGPGRSRHAGRSR
jgi:DNA-3-methyladenine glycosylase